MPELPEVETMVRGIRPHVEGKTLAGVRRSRCRYKPLSIRPSMRQIGRRTRGRTIQSVRRLAKRVVLELDSGDCFVVEPRMTGLMLLESPPSPEHLRIEWRLNGDAESRSLWFWDRRGLGTVALLSPEDMESEVVHKLGPDALEIDASGWKAACKRTTRAIKVAMLDQKFVAGIGNLYASEILHLAGIRPTRRADRLSRAALGRLADATSAVLERAIRYEGSTLSDGTYRNALNRNGRYQNEHRVYDKAGETCGTCSSGVIKRTVQAQRSTFYCPRCQR